MRLYMYIVSGGVMTLGEAIVTSTKNSSELLGIAEKYGTLVEGKLADFLVLKENPLENIETLLDVELVYKHGGLIE